MKTQLAYSFDGLLSINQRQNYMGDNNQLTNSITSDYLPKALAFTHLTDWKNIQENLINYLKFCNYLISYCEL